MRLTTTLARIRANSPCKDGWCKLVKHLGKDYGDDTPVNLLTILDSNGVQDMLWCLRATVEDSKPISSRLAIEFAAEVLPIFEARYPDDQRPRMAIQGARDYADGKIDKAAAYAAYAAAYAAADAAYAAAYAAADAAYAAAYAAADAAAYAAADAAYAAAYAAADAAYAAAYAAADAAAYAAADAAADAAAYAAADAAADAAARAKAVSRQADIIRSILES